MICIAIAASLCAVQAEEAPKWLTSLIDSRGVDGSLALDSSGTPHVVFPSWSIVTRGYFDFAESSLYYAVLNGTNWVIRGVDGSGNKGCIALDSHDNPHIVYSSGDSSSDTFTLKYAVLKDGDWSIQTVDSGQRLQFSMALDSTGNPHVVYNTYNYAKNHLASGDTLDIKYAFFNGVSWTLETIDTVNSNFGSNELSIVLDSNNLPHVIYREDADTSGSSYDKYEIIYAKLSGSQWKTQTATNEVRHVGNLF